MFIFAIGMNAFADTVCRFARWVRRFRHRRGYGVHSPFAFALITGVVYERGEYYAYRPLRALRQGVAGELRERDDRLMLRLANAFRPRYVVVWGRATALTLRYLQAGCADARYSHVEDGNFDALAAATADGVGLLYVDDAEAWPRVCDACLPHATEGALFVVRGIRRNHAALAAWRRLTAESRVRVTFDLYDFGLACFESRLHKQDYIVNYW